MSIVQYKQKSHLYEAKVLHQRFVAPYYKFTIPLFYVVVDLNEIERLEKKTRFFSWNKFNLVSLRGQDFGMELEKYEQPQDLKNWVHSEALKVGVNLSEGVVLLLTMPRILGMSFNPISFWYCYDKNRLLVAVLAEVRNTFGERHHYWLSDKNLTTSEKASRKQFSEYECWVEKEKVFHVSPFLELQGSYKFKFDRLTEKLKVVIEEYGSPSNQLQLRAVLTGRSIIFSDKNLFKLSLKFPFQMIAVMWGIHWQALKIWLRGGKFHKKPELPNSSIT